MTNGDHAYQIVAEASNGIEALEVLKKVDADLVIMDINMDEMDGISCTEKIGKLYPHLKVLALTMLNENLHIKQMLKAGAVGYLLKNCGEDDLKNAINTIYEGRTFYSPEVTRVFMNSFNGQKGKNKKKGRIPITCLLYTSPSPRDQRGSRMPSSA